MPTNLKINPPLLNNYTGEGFKGERVLAVTAVVLTIVSSALLIHLSLLQRRQIKEEMAINRKKREEEAKKNGEKKS